MKRMIAWVVYVLGGVFALKIVFAGFIGGSVFDAFGGIAYGIVFWWITVGIGVRLGVTPDDFLASLAGTLGFGERAKWNPPAEPAKESRSSD
jgi:hypothetical protein